MFFLALHFLLINNAFLGALFSQLVPCGCCKSFLAIPGSHERDKQHFLGPSPHSPGCSAGLVDQQALPYNMGEPLLKNSIFFTPRLFSNTHNLPKIPL